MSSYDEVADGYDPAIRKLVAAADIGPWHRTPVAEHEKKARPGHVGTRELSPRQLEVLALAALGLSDKQIGEFLGIGEETVKTRMRQILSKLEARTRTHAVAIGFRKGILS